MPKKKKMPRLRTTEAMTQMELIADCGKLKYPVSKVISILYADDDSIDQADLLSILTTPGTREYDAYHSGEDMGDYEIDSALHHDAKGGDTFSQEALSKIQEKRAIDSAVKNAFFPSGDVD